RPQADITHRALHRQNAAFPFRVKGRLARLGQNRPEAVHAAHVVNAVHGAMSPGCLGNPVPIMQSRVTSSASFCSLQSSVPEGRIGKTRNRVSAVESQTRIWVLAGSVTPKSLSTPRGSIT